LHTALKLILGLCSVRMMVGSSLVNIIELQDKQVLYIWVAVQMRRGSSRNMETTKVIKHSN
jgi:hypothetical protein